MSLLGTSSSSDKQTGKHLLSSLQHSFIELVLERRALEFGSFQLKSGRSSHFFFNLGKLIEGQDFNQLGRWYAQRLVDSGLNFDTVFGPAYKGIPLATATVMSLATAFQRNVALAYNRKETKAHGEGGQWVGPIDGRRIVLVDDVLTAGTAILQSAELITKNSGTLVAILIALDRQAKISPQQTAAEQLSEQLKVPVLSLVNLTHIADYLDDQQQITLAEQLRAEIFSYPEKV